MSTNIHFFGQRKVVVVTTKKIEIQREKIGGVQTPTDVTWQIMQSSDVRKAYTDWVMEQFGTDEQVPVFAEDDVWEEGEPIGTKTINDGKRLVDEFNEACAELEARGFEIKAEAW